MQICDLHTVPSAMPRPLSLAQHTLYADLLEQGIGDLFDTDFAENGSILMRPGRMGGPAQHAYYQGYRRVFGGRDRGQRYARYLGRADDPAVASRIARFSRVKAVRAERATTVRALIEAGMPRPDRMTGQLVEALARAGLFPDAAVLLGAAAYQTYGGILGVRLSTALSKPVGDAETRSIQVALRAVDQTAKIHAALCGVDPSFAPWTCSADPTRTTCFQNADRVRVDVSTVNAEPILFKAAVSAVVLFGPGIPVTVPAPECWLIRTLIGQGQRTIATGDTNRALARAAELVKAVSIAGRSHLLAKGLREACRAELQNEIQHLPAAARTILEGCFQIRQVGRTL
ncbi:GSU2403 family nucleotidyltransferase fold protein [Methylobacterium tardum]|uniref:GSU2403 family nucleotidyltransferase fold protein n=1 Tax=Methylobacterium tardum TaxID=374432 RepID=UPI002020001A|nr:GSU2403 family nucleotidyltransferase fold protein [Methylobacterium tardum]URD38198.1 GSU2403 family nucleotidyltransferase fold protein [Methylobacterium tardum]